MLGMLIICFIREMFNRELFDKQNVIRGKINGIIN